MDLDALKEFLAEPSHGGWGIGGMEALTLEPGHVVARREVTAELANFAKTLHGGAAATLVDVAGSLALATGDRHGRFGVTTDLNASWLAPAPLGEWIQIEAQVLKIGKTMGYVAVDIRRESDGVLAVQGRMTKHMGDVPA